MLTYDRTIFKGNRIENTIQDVASNLEIPYKRQDLLIKALNRALKTLNRYELDDQHNLKVELTKNKIDNQYRVIAKRYLKNKQIATV
ncbi:hypothetical protein AGMMS49936_09390 [Endomicrobiia bacterium]|nr:hypothetical protein AGMMS49936_09390 [Endomicrobiia bacterium]